jgi:hypothetical protein
MTRGVRRFLLAGAILAMATAPAAQTGPADQPSSAAAPGRQGGRAAPPAGAPAPGSGALTNEEVYTLLDAFVMARAQTALQLNDAQFSAFFQRMMRLQKLQAMHRRQRLRLLNELRQLVNPRAPDTADEAAVATKTKELDDAEAQMDVDERKALTDIDQVLQVRQRAHLRIFLEMMERQKLELLIKARQSAGAAAPVAATPPGRGGK